MVSLSVFSTHRVEAIAYNYKVKAKMIDPITAAEKRALGKNRELAFNSLLNTPASKTYKAPTAKELKSAIELLCDFPIAQKAAQNDLDTLPSS